MNLYAAHDVNIVTLIYALDFENKTIEISFLSSIIFELLVDNETSNSYIKVSKIYTECSIELFH